MTSTRTRTRRTALALLAATILLAGCNQQRSTPAFDEARAFKDVETQLAFGPRVPGTPAHDRCQEWIAAELAKTGATPALQAFPDTVYGQVYAFTNVRARYGPKDGPWIVVGAHWDTRAVADNDPDPAKRALPIPGANDGASGVAVLLEMARMMKRNPPGVGVDIVFFDGEDLGTEADPNGWFRGSTRYVEQIADKKPPLFVIVVDMVGKKDLALHWEGNSREQASNIVDLVWGQASSQGVRSFRSDVRHKVFDDHTPFLNAGIPAIDIIDFDYPEWHTTHDTPEKCSPESLEGVGRVLLSLVTKPTFLSN